MDTRGKIAIALLAVVIGCSEEVGEEIAEDAGEGGVIDRRDAQIKDASDDKPVRIEKDGGERESDAQAEEEDASEPETNCENSGCSRFATCDDSSGEVVCDCREGFSGDGFTCVDDNECIEEDICDENAVCENLLGDYSCECKSGYVGDGESCDDLDECEESEDDCSSNAICINTIGSYACNCEEGYEGDGRRCTDIDECEGDTTNCHPAAECVNEEPGFRCECGDGYTGDGYATGESSGCRDIDECANNTYSCPPNTRCRNVRGGDPGYICQCDVGFALDGEECRPLCDIALEDPEVCDPNAICRINTDGEAECVQCQFPYLGDGKECVFDSDCDALQCGDNAVCVESSGGGSLECECALGFDGNPGEACSDIDECDAGEPQHECDCDSESDCTDTSEVTFCFNSPGGYSCECIAGYRKQEGVCVNVDECAEDPNNCGPSGNQSCICDSLSTCSDRDPGFDCICDDGYQGDGKVACVDINECDETNPKHECNSDVSRCINVPGNEGKYRCTDIDECDPNETEHPDGCDDFATCTNIVCSNSTTCRDSEFDGYSCSCEEDEGFLGSGYGSTGCYCDLTGYWAMRVDVLITWEGVFGMLSGSLNTTAWELHKYEYDGEKITVEKKGCGQQEWPEIRVAILETYSTYVPRDVFDFLPLFPGADIPLSSKDARPNKYFVTPTEAAVVGLDMEDPLNGDWPENSDPDIPWHDTDSDGIDGVTMWSRGPSEESRDGRAFSYTPVEIEGLTDVVARGGCFSSAVRTRTHLNVKMESCSRLTGDVEQDYEPESLFYACTLVDEDDWDSRDVVCSDVDDPDSDWNTASRCEPSQLAGLNDAAPAQETTSSFELVKMDESSPDCDDVRAMLPPLY